MNGTSYMSYDSFCKSCINVLRLQFTKAELKQLFNAIDKDKNGKYIVHKYYNGNDSDG